MNLEAGRGGQLRDRVKCIGSGKPRVDSQLFGASAKSVDDTDARLPRSPSPGFPCHLLLDEVERLVHGPG